MIKKCNVDGAVTRHGLNTIFHKCESSVKNNAAQVVSFPWREHHIGTIHSNCRTRLQKEFIEFSEFIDIDCVV